MLTLLYYQVCVVILPSGDAIILHFFYWWLCIHWGWLGMRHKHPVDLRRSITRCRSRALPLLPQPRSSPCAPASLPQPLTPSVFSQPTQRPQAVYFYERGNYWRKEWPYHLWFSADTMKLLMGSIMQPKYNWWFNCLFKPNQNISINEPMVAYEAIYESQAFAVGGINLFCLPTLQQLTSIHGMTLCMKEGECSPQARLWAPPLMDLLPCPLLSGGHTLCGHLLFLASGRQQLGRNTRIIHGNQIGFPQRE